MKKQRFSKLICCALALIFLMTAFSVAADGEGQNAAAQTGTPQTEEPKDTATRGHVVTYSSVKVRTAPNSSSPVVTTTDGKSISLPHGYEVIIEDTVFGDDPECPAEWYKFRFSFEGKEYGGYMYSIYMALDPSPEALTADAEFEKLIENLPEDYKLPLRKLKTLHPSWQFRLLDTGLDWEEVLDNECVYGRNLVSTETLSQRSTDSSCYNWLTDTYTAIEGDKWFQASRDTIAYYMDPRNFLAEDSVFQFEALSYESQTQTIDGVSRILAGTFMDGTKISDGKEKLTYAEVFMRAAQLSGVSPYHLTARCRQEVGVNGGKGTTGKTSGYEGYYNFYNIGANTGVMAGLKYAKTGGSLSAESKEKYMIPWNSPYKAVVGGAIFIGSTYINKGQNTLYLEKYDVEETNGLYWHQYMVNVSAAYNESRNIFRTYRALGLMDSPLTFIIPVFRNMPSEPCRLPTREGSINNRLSDLSVGGFALTPTFSHDVSNYSIVSDSALPASVNVSAVPVTDKAKITGDVGTVKLTQGLNTLIITVTAENGDKNYYTVYIAPSADLIPPDPPQTPTDAEDPVSPSPTGTTNEDPPKTVTTGSFSVSLPHDSWLIWGLGKGSTLETLLGALGLKGTATAKFTDPSGKQISTGKITTDIFIQLEAGDEKAYYRTLIYGDVDCDGDITAVDLLMIRRMLLGTYTPPSEAPKVAADTDRDGKISAVDLLMVRREILGTYSITQS